MEPASGRLSRSRRNPRRLARCVRHVERGRLRQGRSWALPRARRPWGCLVFVCLDADAPPLADELGDLPERSRDKSSPSTSCCAGSTTRSPRTGSSWRRTSWSTTTSPWVHPGLVKVSPMKDHYRWQGTGVYMGFCTSPIAANTEDGGWKGLPALSTLGEDVRVSARFAWLFPNIALNVLPNHTFLILARPTEAGVTEEIHLPPRPSRVRGGRRRGTRRRDRCAARVLGRREPRGHRDRRAGPARALQPGLPGGRMCYRFEDRCTGSRTW